ncbi:hypothetical protein D3C77_633900 [compost metagenome]
MRIVVRIGSADVYDISFRCLVDDRLSLQLSYANVIKGNVVVYFGIVDQAVVRNDLDTFFMCLLHNRRGRFRIVRDDNEHVDALRNELFRLT